MEGKSQLPPHKCGSLLPRLTMTPGSVYLPGVGVKQFRKFAFVYFRIQRKVVQVSFWGTLKYMARHPLTWRVLKSLDEMYALVQEIRAAVSDKRVTPQEIEKIIGKLEAAVEALMEE